MSVLVVGGGIAGCAAVFTLQQRVEDERLRIHWVTGGAGASQLHSGALDFGAGEGIVQPLPTELRNFASKMGWSLTEPSSVVATLSGQLRGARGVDAGVLDLLPLAGQRIGVLDVARPGFEAAWLARSYSETSWAKRTRTRFVPVQAQLFSPKQLMLSDYDLAARVDAEAPRTFAVVRRALSDAGVDAGLTGPWFGLTDAVQQVRTLAGLPLGQTLSPVGGVAGARFESAGASLQSNPGLKVHAARLVRLKSQSSEVVAQLSNADELKVSTCLLCTGGIAGGGIVLAGESAQLQLSYEVTQAADASQLGFELDGLPLFSAASEAGVDVTARGLEVLERVGVSASGQSRIGPRLYAAGDMVSGWSRTALAAAMSGISAATTLLQDDLWHD